MLENRWHKWPEEQVPDVGWYLVATKYEPYQEVASWDGLAWEDVECLRLGDVTHWRPLPERPREEH